VDWPEIHKCRRPVRGGSLQIRQERLIAGVVALPLPDSRLSLGASLPNGSYEIEYHGAGTKRVAVDVRLKLMSSYEIRPFPLF